MKLLTIALFLCAVLTAQPRIKSTDCGEKLTNGYYRCTVTLTAPAKKDIMVSAYQNNGQTVGFPVPVGKSTAVLVTQRKLRSGFFTPGSKKPKLLPLP